MAEILELIDEIQTEHRQLTEKKNQARKHLADLKRAKGAIKIEIAALKRNTDHAVVEMEQKNSETELMQARVRSMKVVLDTSASTTAQYNEATESCKQEIESVRANFVANCRTLRAAFAELGGGTSSGGESRDVESDGGGDSGDSGSDRVMALTATRIVQPPARPSTREWMTVRARVVAQHQQLHRLQNEIRRLRWDLRQNGTDDEGATTSTLPPTITSPTVTTANDAGADTWTTHKQSANKLPLEQQVTDARIDLQKATAKLAAVKVRIQQLSADL